MKNIHLGLGSKTLNIFATFVIICTFMITTGSTNLNAQCSWIPSGVSTTPAWTQGAPNARVYITRWNCWVEFEWCYRIVNGEKQVILGRQIVSGTTPWWWFSSCKHEYNKRKQLMQDYAVSVIVNQLNIFNDPYIKECPDYEHKYYQVYAAKCLSEPYYEWTQSGGQLVKAPCNTEGYCKYEYKYCYKMVNGVQTSTYERTLINTGGTECPGDFYEPITEQTYDCYPGDCYPNLGHKKDPTEDDVLDWEDSNYYIHYDITNISNW